MPYGRRGGEIVVNKQLAGIQYAPSIAAFASGGFIVVWNTLDTLQDGSGRAIKAQRYDSSGNAVGAELLINSAVTGDQRAPSVTTLANGGYVVTWETSDTTQDGSGFAIKGQLFDSSGAAVGAEFRANSQTVADQTKASVTGLQGGGFVVTWQTADSTQDGHTSAIKGQIFNASGAAVGGEFLVNTGAVGAESSPSVTSLSGGGFVATWTLGSGTSADIYAQVFTSTGAKSGGQFLVNSTTPFNQDSASVSEISGGRFVVTWSSASSLTSGDGEIRARIFSANGTPIGNDFVVSTTRVQAEYGFPIYSSQPSVDDLPNGGFVITWTHSGGNYMWSSIRGQFFDANGARVGTEVLVSAATDRLEGQGDVAVDGNGMMFAVWGSANQSATNDDIRGQIFVASGAPEIVSNGGGDIATVSVAENQNAVTTVTAVDADASGTLVYSIAGGLDASRFAINASTGALTFVSAPNFEVKADSGNNNIYNVLVSVTDGVNTDIQELSVTVTNVNEGVTISGSETSFMFAENRASVATFSATDADGDAVSWSIAGGADAALFAIDPVTGALRFITAPNFEAPADAGANNVYDVVISASDGSLATARALTVEILDYNEGPLIVSGGGGDSASISVAENVNLATTVVADDPDFRDSAFTFTITGGADAALFRISAIGQLFFRTNVGANFEAPADADHNNVYEVTVSVSDGFNPADTQALFITVTDANDPPVITSNGGGFLASVSVPENQLAVTTVTASDLENAVLTYSITGGADSARFTLNAQTGVLSFVSAADYEAPVDVGANNVYNVTVSVSDGDKSATQQLSVTVLNANDAPIITSNGGGSTAAIAVAENGLAVTLVTASDLEGAALSYSIAGGADASRFAINASTGALSFVAAPDYEQPGDADGDNVYLVTVQASDGALADSQALSITVGNVNERPVIVSNGGGASASIRIDEGQTAVTNVMASDVDGPGALTYSIGGGANAALFAIDSATGALSFIAAPDYEAPAAGSNNVYSVTVSASDGMLSSSQALQVTVGNVNEGVTITSGPTASVVENGTAVTIVSAVDADGDSVSFSIVGGADAARFAIDSATGTLSFRAAPDYEAPGDSDSNNVYEVVVSASDGSLSASKALSVTVTNQNEAIAFVSGGGGDRASVTIGENSGSVMALLAVDPDGTSPQYGIAGGADAALFELDPATHALRFKALPDFEHPRNSDGDNVYEVVVGATDGQTFDYQSISVTVANVYEGVSFGASDFQFPAAENSSAVGAVAAVSGEGRALTYSIGGGEDSALFAIDSATGAISFIAAPDFEAPRDSGADNIYHLTVTASDGTSGASQAVTVVVGNVDEAVQLSSYGGAGSVSLAMAENDTQIGRVKAFDPDGTTVTYSIAGGADSGLFRVDAATGSLSFLSAPDFERPRDVGADNVYDVVVAAASGGSTATQTFAVSITNRNEGIFITSNGGGASATVAVGENGLAATRVTAFDPDGTAPSFQIVGGADAARFTIDAQSGVLTFVSAPDYEAPGDSNGDNVYRVSVAASDGEFSARQDLSIVVGNVNEGVDITSGGGGSSASLTMAENATAVTVVAARDADGDRVTYAIAGGADAARFTIDAATGALAFVSAPDFEAPSDAGANNVYDVVVSASDGTFVDAQALAVTVGNVNEAVVITSSGGGASATATVAENGTAVLKVGASDPDGGPVTYAIAGGADAARFTIDAATGSLAFVSAPDFEAPTDAGENNVYDVVVSASDGTFVDTQALAVSVGNVNEAVVITSNGGGATATATIAENTVAVLRVSASDPEGGSVTYAIAGGADAARFTIDAATGSLAFLSAPDFEAPSDAGTNNVYDVIVSASDGTFVDTQALAISVTNVNEAVVITSNGGGAAASATVAENGTAVLKVSASDPDGGPVTYAIAGGADAARFTIDAATGSLAFLASPNFEAPSDVGANNVYDVVVSASDGSFVDTQALAISVANVNEPVTITSNGGGASATATIAENTTAVLRVSASDADGGPVAYAIAGGADAARFTIDAVTGSLAFLSAPNFEAPSDAGANNVYDVIVSASDGTFVDTQALAVTVGNVNEALAITSNGGGATGSVSVVENGASVTIVTAADPEGVAATYSIVGGADAARFTINAQTGALQFVAAPDWELPGDSDKDNVYAVIVRASDGQFSDDQALSVSVANTRDGANVTGTAGNDTISATSAAALRTTNSEDLVFGRDGHDTIYGMGGDDELYGEAGNDILVGGEGADRLLGGLGKDQFTFNSVSESTAGSIDLIQDFSRSQADKISLSGIDANSLLIGDQAFSFIGTSAFSHVAGQLRFETSGGVTTIWGDVNGDGVGDLQIQLSGSITLVASDFLL
ncbi:MAG: hypothetical protein QOJ91_380 [Sphingomonadales bacterium]|jgi:hypothetical protein|nr:hypothetical protein [Sphingomonadales bacterium]